MTNKLIMLAKASFLGLVAGLAASAALADPVGGLAGRWSGWGSIVLGSGNTEQVRCIATYIVKDDSGAVQQNLRCASASYKIDSVANLVVASGHVTGNWEERTTSSSGSVSGRLTGSGFNLSIQGPQFSAAMAVTTSACTQSINIAPRGIDVSRISIGLGKC